MNTSRSKYRIAHIPRDWKSRLLEVLLYAQEPIVVNSNLLNLYLFRFYT
jgi:hypothetical protein